MELKFNVSYDAVPRINDLIASLNKKYGKAGIVVKENNRLTRMTIDGIENLNVYHLKIEIEFPKIQHDGYTYIGTLQKVILDNGDVVIQSFGNLPNEYRTVEFRCDHCNSNRNRHTVNIFKNENDQLKIIGSTCSKEYFGENVYSQICKFLGFSIEALMSDIDEWEGGNGGWEKERINKALFVNYAYGLMKLSGKYISKAKSEESFLSMNPISSTRNEVEYYMQPIEMIDRKYRDAFKAKVEQLDTFSLDYNKLVEFWNTLDSTDTFIYNTQIALRMRNPQLGLIVYAVYKYLVDVEDFNKSKIDYTKSVHVGEIKEKITQNVTILKLIDQETVYGITTIVKMISDTGNVFTWFASNCPAIEENKSYTITGTVKDHSEYKGIKQTILTRCKIK